MVPGTVSGQQFFGIGKGYQMLVARIQIFEIQVKPLNRLYFGRLRSVPRGFNTWQPAPTGRDRKDRKLLA